MNTITYENRIPEIEEYLYLRISVGFSSRSREAAEKGLPGSLFSVTARKDGEAVGMARIVGDGGCSFLIVDVIVLPEMQGRGIGTEMFRRLSGWMEDNIPPGGMVTLIADEPGRKLYERYGFTYTAPESVGMKRHM